MFVTLLVDVCVDVFVVVEVGVLVAVFVDVLVDELVAVCVFVLVAVFVNVAVNVFVAVFVGVFVNVEVPVAPATPHDSKSTIKHLIFISTTMFSIFQNIVFSQSLATRSTSSTPTRCIWHTISQSCGITHVWADTDPHFDLCLIF